MQKGSIRISGKWWYLKVRENVTENGQAARKLMYHKLAPVDRYRPSSNGEPPAAIRAMADEKLAPINAGKREGLSADSWKAYLESYLASGLGADGRPVRKVTLKAYRRDYRVIKDLIPDIQLRSIRTPDINKLFKALIAADGDDMRATSAYRNVRNFLSGAFRAAVGDGLVDFNPVRDAMVLTGNDADTYAYKLPEVKQLMNAIKDDSKSADDWRHTMRATFMVALFTGLRLEEIKGLKWTDYDRDNQLLHIRRIVVNHQIVEDTKTKASKAPVVVVKTVAKALEEHLKRNSGEGFIFHKANSSQAPIIFEHIMLTQVQPTCRAAGITFPIQMHAFRRGLDTWMKDAGIDLSLRTDIMRHSPRNVTDKHYGRASVKQMRVVLEKMEDAYKKQR
jgi:integrase